LIVAQERCRVIAQSILFVEKLQTISTKFRLQQENKIMPVNFLRHYYDVYKLLENDRVLQFIGTDNYHQHKQLRFRGQDEIIKLPVYLRLENRGELTYKIAGLK
jgi:polyferredoxin